MVIQCQLLAKRFGLNYKTLPLMYESYMLLLSQYISVQYLLVKQFIIETNQKSLKELMSQVVKTSNQHFFIKILGYDYIISYKPGKANKAVNLYQEREPSNISTTNTLYSFF